MQISKLFTFLSKKIKKNMKGASKNPFFYFGLVCFVLFGVLFTSSNGLAQPNYLKNADAVFFNPFFTNPDALNGEELFVDQNRQTALETPDLKTIQDNSISAVSTPTVLTSQTLGDIFGGSDVPRKDIVDYTVVVGDTVESIAKNFGVSAETIAWANSISKNTNLKAGDTLTILPVSGLLYVVKNGDTLSQISKTYKSKTEDIVAFNGLANESDIFIGDTLVLPDGILPSKAAPSLLPISVPLADNFFIFPTEGYISQRLHYFNGVDVANKCGTPIYAAASGTVQRAVGSGGWNLGMGNYITILHSNGTVTYYGHLMTLFVKPGDHVATGDRIGLMGQTGKATGCHIHFQVLGAQNPLAKYGLGAKIQYK